MTADQDPPRRAERASRSLVLGARVLLLLLAAGAVVTAFALTRGGARESPHPEVSAPYVCPMHPEVRATRPGSCPICGMALERRAATGQTREMERRGMEGAAMADPMPTDPAIQNIRDHRDVEPVRRRSLLLEAREMRGPAWVTPDGQIDAIFYRDQVDALAPDERGTFTLTEAPDVQVAVTRAAEPPTPWDASTSRVRFRPAGPDARDAGESRTGASSMKAGRAGWLELARRAREVLTVPDSAILQSARGPYVLVVSRGFHVDKRPIVLGETFDGLGFAVVLSGLRPQEFVVTKETFFIDSDRRLGLAPGEGN